MRGTTDIRALREAKAALARSQDHLQAVVDLAPLILFACDAEGRVTLLRGAGLEVIGVADPAALVGTNMLEQLADRPEMAALLRGALDGQVMRGIARYRDKVFETTHRPQFDDDGDVVGVIGVSYDVTLAHRREDEVRHMAYHDGLTGLANRARLEERLDEALARARRTGTAIALLYIDLDEFKIVNDTLGHVAGDELLREVARRLEAMTRASDLLARHGGDEFMLLVEGLTGEAAHGAEALATKLLGALDDPFRIGGAEFQVGASIGISIWPRHGDNAAELLRHADAALYQAKRRGRGIHAMYDPAVETTRARLTLSARLRRALSDGEFELHYQPIYGLTDGRQMALEALLRWRDPEHGVVLPGDFIAVAETSGLVDELGAWVLDETCRQMRVWMDAGTQPYVSINVAARQLRDTGFVRRVDESLGAHGLSASRLMIELTETAAMRDPERTEPLLRELAALGVRLGIDDFGTGHSSLARLKALPFEAVKIDRSFLAGVPHQPFETQVLDAILNLAGALDLAVVAKGIETEAQREFLVDAGCPFGQGFHLGHPVPPDHLTDGLRR